jgi:hypothetical protein
MGTGMFTSLWFSLSRAANSLKIFASCLAVVSCKLAPEEALRARLRGCKAVTAELGARSGTYAHPGAVVALEFATSRTPKLIMVS